MRRPGRRSAGRSRRTTSRRRRPRAGVTRRHCNAAPDAGYPHRLMSAAAPGLRSRDAATEFALLFMCTFWALNVVALKLLLKVLPPPALSASRYLIVCAVAL